MNGLAKKVAGQNKSLSQIVSIRIVAASILALLIQIAICIYENMSDDYYFASWFVKMETGRILAALNKGEDFSHLQGAKGLAHYYGEYAENYGFRVVNSDQQQVFVKNSALLSIFPKPDLKRGGELPDRWLNKKEGGNRFEFSGGRKVVVNGRPYWIEISTWGDPENHRYYALWMDIVEDVLIPVLPTIFLISVFAILGIRFALRPLQLASARADDIKSGEAALFNDLSSMPREAKQFCRAIERLLERNSQLIAKQRFFISRAAHELRTPLAIMILEIGKIKEARARRLEADVARMTATVNRMLTLVGMDSVDRTILRPVNLVAIASEVVQQLAPLAGERAAKVELIEDAEGSVSVCGVPELIREAVINLTENALKHGREGGIVRILCGPGRAITVEDDGPGFGPQPVAPLLEPFARGRTAAEGAGIGLAIVAQVAAVHGADLQIGASWLGGARISLHFPHAMRGGGSREIKEGGRL